jgi:Uma2 family endonuclease
MSTITENVLPQVHLIDSDGEPLESPWHWLCITLLIDCIRYHLRPRTDFFAGGNMFLYYSEQQARNRDYRGPDFFFVDDIDGTRPRRWWAVWEEEGRYPDVIMELLSASTAEVDLTVKRKLYERTFRTPEYYCYDPDAQELLGWRLNDGGRYQAIPADERGWLWCEKLQLWIGLWTGTHLGQDGTFPRFYDAQRNLVPTHAEAATQRADLLEAEIARLSAQHKQGQKPNGS